MTPSDLTKEFAFKCFEEYKKVSKSKGAKSWYSIPKAIMNHYSNAELTEILKDPYWLKASATYYYSHNNSDPTFNQCMWAVKNFIRLAFEVGHPCTSLIIKYSDGLILGQAIESCNDHKLKKLATRGLSSKDYRVRARATKYCPVSKLKKMLKDPRKSVRSRAIKRLGIHNVANLLLEDPAVDIRLNAAIALGDFDTIKSILEKESDKINKSKSPWTKTSWRVRYRIKEIISALPKQDILYNLDVKEAGGLVQSLVEAKIDD